MFKQTQNNNIINLIQPKLKDLWKEEYDYSFYIR